jgi:uncharacterized membrane protein YfcA
MLILAGFLTGLLVGTTGVGGGALMTPLLLLVFGVAPNLAVGTDLLFAAITKSAAVGFHQAKQLIDWQVTRRLWLGSLPVSLICLIWFHFSAVKSSHYVWLTQLIGYVLILMAFGMLFQTKLHRFGEHLRKTQAETFKKWQPLLTIIAGAVLGLLVSLTSIGAGALGAVLLAYLYPLRLTPARLVATDIAHAIPLALFAGGGHALLGNVDYSLLGTLLLGSIPGVIIGAKFSSKLPQALLRNVISVVLVIIGLKIITSIPH